MGEFQGFILVLILIWMVSIVRAILNKSQTEGRQPPTPPSLPLIGHFLYLLPLPHQAFHNLSTRYGPIMQLYLGSVPCVVASTPETVKEFFKTHESSYSGRFVNFAIDHLTYGCKGLIFAAYGPYWKFMKKLCMSQLLGGRTLDILQPVRRTETMRFLRLLLKKGTAGESIDVGEELLTLTNNVISRMTMGRTSCGNDDEARDIRKLVVAIVELSGKFDLRDFVGFLRNFKWNRLNKSLRETRDRFDVLMEKVIKEHEDERRNRKEQGSDHIKDLLHILLDIREDQSSDIKLTMENIKAFIMV